MKLIINLRFRLSFLFFKKKDNTVKNVMQYLKAGITVKELKNDAALYFSGESPDRY